MKKYSIIILMLLTLVIFIPIDVLTVEDMYNDTTYLVRHFKENDTFIMKWIHSVELEPWEEWFSKIDDDIVLRKTRFRAFGAGVPDSGGEETYIEDDYVVFDKINTIMPSITYGISPLAQHTLIVKDETFLLYELLPADTGVSIELKKMILVKYLILR